MLSPIECLPPELYGAIVLHTIPFLGPPSDLPTFLVLSSTLYHKLHDEYDNFLWSVYTQKFDFAAVKRRFRHLVQPGSPQLTAELISRCLLLRRLRYSLDPSAPTLEHDFWKITLMLMENDGKNEAQLFQYANLSAFVHKWRMQTFSHIPPTTAPVPYPQETTLTSLGLYLLWRVHTPELARQAVLSGDASLWKSLLPYNVACFKYAVGYAPDVHYDFPISNRLQASSETRPLIHTPYPVYRPAVNLHSSPSNPPPAVVHFGIPLPLVPPLLIHSSLLLHFTSTEVHGFQPSDATPFSRAERDARGFVMASVEDYHDHNQHAKTKFVPQESSSESERFDKDFMRLLWCGNPEQDPCLPMQTFHNIGSLTGLWEGRFLFPDFEDYTGLQETTDLKQGFDEFRAGVQAMNVVLEEWYCPVELNPMGGANSLTEAWFPKDTTFEPSLDGDTLDVKTDKDTYTYHRWRPDRGPAHPKDECTFCNDSADSDSEDLDEGRLFCVDPALHRPVACPRYLDVIVTGRTTQRHAKAWGNYKWYGRIRPYDGMIALVRQWAEPEANGHGRWVFRGYLTADQNLVGRWRAGDIEPTNPGTFEGSFSLSKRTDWDGT